MRNLVKNPRSFSRPTGLTAAITALPLLLSLTANVAASDVPLMDQGVQIGDPEPGRAIIWSRADRPSQMMLKYAFNDQFTNATTIRGPYATSPTVTWGGATIQRSAIEPVKVLQNLTVSRSKKQG